jgi:hypothetical protein
MEENYADIYYVDTRNAREHRTQAPAGGWRPSGGGPAGSPNSRVSVNSTPAQYVRAPYPTAYPTAYPMTYPGQVYPGQPTALGSLFGGMPVGQILDLVATAFAALAPLPQAPNATRDTTTDLGNLMLYQSALADHAKRDERIRTIGSLVGKLVA